MFFQISFCSVFWVGRKYFQKNWKIPNNAMVANFDQFTIWTELNFERHYHHVWVIKSKLNLVNLFHPTNNWQKYKDFEIFLIFEQTSSYGLQFWLFLNRLNDLICMPFLNDIVSSLFSNTVRLLYASEKPILSELWAKKQHQLYRPR